MTTVTQIIALWRDTHINEATRKKTDATANDAEESSRLASGTKRDDYAQFDDYLQIVDSAWICKNICVGVYACGVHCNICEPRLAQS